MQQQVMLAQRASELGEYEVGFLKEVLLGLEAYWMEGWR